MTINAIDLLKQAVTEGASDLFIVAGLPVSMRRQGNILRIGTDRLLPDDTQSVISQIYELADRRSMSVLNNEGDDDFSFAVPGLSRFRVSAYKQRNTLSVVVRFHCFRLQIAANKIRSYRIVRHFLPKISERSCQAVLCLCIDLLHSLAHIV